MSAVVLAWQGAARAAPPGPQGETAPKSEAKPKAEAEPEPSAERLKAATEAMTTVGWQRVLHQQQFSGVRGKLSVFGPDRPAQKYAPVAAAQLPVFAYGVALDLELMSEAEARALVASRSLRLLKVFGPKPRNPKVLEILSTHAGVQHLDLGFGRYPFEAIATLAGMPGLRAIAINEHSDDLLAGLAGAGRLHLLETCRVAGESDERPSAPGDVKRIRLAGWKLTATGLDELKSLPSLEAVELRRMRVGPDEQDALLRFTRLRELTLNGIAVHDKDVARLATLPELAVLRLGGTEITDDVMPAVAGMKRLRELDLSGTKVGDAGVAKLAGASKLQVLRLDATAVTDRVVDSLKTMPALRVVALVGTSISSAGVRELKHVPALQEFDVATPDDAVLAAMFDAGMVHKFTAAEGADGRRPASVADIVGMNLAFERTTGRLTDASARRLAGLASLRRLNLNGQQVTDEGIAALAGLERLEALDLRGTDVAGACVAGLAKLTDLRWLGLSTTDVRASSVGPLLKLPRLKSLLLEDTQFDDAGITLFAEAGKLHLLNRAGSMTDGTGARADRDELITHLSLSPAPSVLGASSVRHLAALPQLQALTLERCGLKSADLASLADCKRLTELDLKGNALDDDCVAVLSKIKTLRRLVLSDRHMTQAGLAALRKALPDCDINP